MGHTISRHARMLGKRLLLGFTAVSHPPRPLQGRNFYKFLSLFLSKTGCNRGSIAASKNSLIQCGMHCKQKSAAHLQGGAKKREVRP
jgi:hypothetical protein